MKPLFPMPGAYFFLTMWTLVPLTGGLRAMRGRNLGPMARSR